MKKRLLVLALPLVVLACNNEGKDSVEKADSANEAKMDSNSTTSATLQTDAESSEFLVKAADGGMAEVDMGNMANQKGASAHVKNYGAMLVKDHSAANEKVKALAAQRNVTLPATVSDANKSSMDDMMKKSGKDFDKSYMDAMIKDHEKDIDMFKSASNKVNDAEVKSFIDNTIPTLQVHLDSAKAIRKMLK